MRFSIGYQLPDENDCTVDLVKDFRNHVSEVYFALPGAASGRSPLGIGECWNKSKLQSVMEDELSELSGMGIDLVLLFNATCYGEQAIASAFASKIQKTVGRLLEKYNIAAITTSSPFVARTIKQEFNALKIRASVNMRIGTIKGMEYLADCFDGYYMQREWNRDFSRIEDLKSWCDTNNKTLYLLANSGCLSHCSFQSFHDNLVAHEAGVIRRKNVSMKYPAPCWEYVSCRENWVSILQNTWIRPEDLYHYKHFFPTVKLATRMHANPRKVIGAYVRECFRGNLFDLMEPSYSPIFKGYIIDNTRFPSNWFEKTTKCDKNCQVCTFCDSVLEKVLIKVKCLK